MTILSAQTLRLLRPIEPFCERSKFGGMSYGLGPAGYDVRIDQMLYLAPGDFMLASTLERFDMPNICLGVVHDKSTLARMGLAVQNTIIEPGWQGYLTLELANHGKEHIEIFKGSPIAQIIFHLLDQPTDTPYTGKYQNQERRPVKAIFEFDKDAKR